MFEDNNFARDTNEQHNQRVMLCALAAANFDFYLALLPFKKGSSD